MGRRAYNRLTATQVQRLREPGRHADGDGLYLQVTPVGVRSWIFRYQREGRERSHGLGPVRDVTLAEAREAARECAAGCSGLGRTRSPSGGLRVSAQ
jgi:hypothetical protein